MEPLIDLAEGIAATLLAFLLGLTWRRIVAAVHRRARRFWRPVMSEDLQLVVGRFRGLKGFEASGVIGAGDSLAMHRLGKYFDKIGFHSFEISFNDQLGYGDPSGKSLRTNLILLGGPDSNTLTNDVLRHVKVGIEFKETDDARPDELLDPRIFDSGAVNVANTAPRPGISSIVRRLKGTEASSSSHKWRTPVFVDTLIRNTIYRPTKLDDDIVSDCGAVLRVPNPFAPSKNVIIVCGSYGYGTWAAIDLVQSKAFLRNVARSAKAIECIFRVDVVRDTPQRPEICLFREASNPRPAVISVDGTE